VGKSQVAELIRAKLQAIGTTVHVISEDGLKLSRTSVFASAGTEKQARGAVLTAVERLLSPETVVIVDAMNYVKGFRYQLWCHCKEGTGPSCVVHVAGSLEAALEANSKRPEGPTKYAAGV
jgi:protein KTI12